MFFTVFHINIWANDEFVALSMVCVMQTLYLPLRQKCFLEMELMIKCAATAVDG